MIHAIIFDCFGVLVGRGFAETYRIAGGDPVADQGFIEDTLGQENLGLISPDEFHGRIAGRIGISEQALMAAIDRAEQPNAELLEYIDELHKTYKTAILSNANRGTLERKLDARALADCFDVLVVSADVGIIKPDPDIYRLVAEKLEVEPNECVFIDDQTRYCDGAAAVGMQAIRYVDFGRFKADLQRVLS